MKSWCETRTEVNSAEHTRGEALQIKRAEMSHRMRLNEVTEI